MLASEPPSDELGSFLPASAPHNRAMAMYRQAFDDLASRSQIVILGCRPSGLSADDIHWLDGIAKSAYKATGYKVLSPAEMFLDRRLVSANRQAAMVVVNLPSNFISAATVATVERVEELTHDNRPEGLTLEITGTAGIGRDYAAATEKAVDATTWVTVVAVLLILIVVYRSPVGALVPLATIGASVYLAFVLLAMLSRFGWQVSNVERVFVVVLLFGAGVDYALFWIARYRESLADHLDFESATVTASQQTSPAILAGAGTTICGLSMMLAADLLPSYNAGKILAPVLVVSLLAALTLSPALARLLGRGLFWPMGLRPRASIGQRFLWPTLANKVTQRPKMFLLIGLLVLVVPAGIAPWITPRFDSLSELPEGSSSDRGFKLLEKHYSTGQLFSTQLLLQFDRMPESDEQLEIISQTFSQRIKQLEGIEDIYCLTEPLGGSAGTARMALVDRLLRVAAKRFYVSDVLPILRFEVLIEHRPFSPEAMALIERVGIVAKEEAEALSVKGYKTEALLAGLTPYIIDVRAVSSGDQWRVMTLATLVIGLIVLVLVRDLWLTLFMLLATWLTYGTTLTLSHWFFAEVLGEGGLDWKVRLIVFVIVVAVGQDYNLFLVSRLLRELKEFSAQEAARRAIVSTGAVISSCGIIMAATLGSLWAGELSLLRQVGFTLALGILIDTFFVRPLLIPGFFLATGRGRRDGKMERRRERETEG